MKMYRSISFVIIVLLVSLAFTGCGSPQKTEPSLPVQKVPVVAPDTPAISIDKPVYDFGEVGPGSSGKANFHFTNTGQKTLQIQRVQSTCGCTVPELKKKEYAPGESGNVVVSFRAPNVKGKITKHLYIISNDPKTPRAELTIKADVVVKVSIMPENAELRFDQPNAGMPNVVIKSLDDREFSIKSVTSPNNVIKVDFTPSKKAKEFTLEPQVNTQLLNQFNTGIIQVRTDHPQAGTLAVRYNATPRYEITRPRIILQNVEPGKSITKDVLIRSNYGTNVEIASVKSRNGYMEICLQEKDRAHLKMKIEITPPVQTSSRRYITDQLDIVLKDETKLTIRCSGWYKLK